MRARGAPPSRSREGRARTRCESADAPTAVDAVLLARSEQHGSSWMIPARAALGPRESRRLTAATLTITWHATIVVQVSGCTAQDLGGVRSREVRNADDARALGSRS